MKYKDKEIYYLKHIINNGMFHMGEIEKFECLQDNQFLLKMSKNLCEYSCFIEYDGELSTNVFIIKSVFGRVILIRSLDEKLFPVKKLNQINGKSKENNEVHKNFKDMTLDEIFRQQLELLAEHSQGSITIDELVSLTKAMVEISNTFYRP